MSQPRRKGLKRGKRTGAKLSRAPLQRRKALARNGVAPQSGGGLIAGMVKSGASVYGCCKRDVEVATAWDGNPLPRRGRAETAQLARCEA
uniref:Uncharacterized protein n=1 Tax=Salmonella sp. 14 TaxID=1179812 RepID=I3W390_9ENTR|nr:hypothetical protein [Salmonella sp. 14]